MIQKQLNKINQIGVYEEGRETKYIKNEDLIQRDTTENETENNQDNLKKLIEACPDDQDYEEKTKKNNRE